MFTSSYDQSICAVAFSIYGLFASEILIFCRAIDLFLNHLLFMSVAVVIIISCNLIVSLLEQDLRSF